MYQDHFGLQLDPFPLSPDLRFLFKSHALEETMAHLAYGLQEGEDFILVTGPVGSGKTLALHHLSAQLPPRYRQVMLTVTMLGFNEFLKMVLQELGQFPPPGTDRADLLGMLKQQLQEASRQGGKILLLVDEGQDLPIETIEGIRLLTNLGRPGPQVLQVVLCGQPGLEEKIDSRELEQLRQRIRIRYRLEPLDRRELEEYVRHRLRVAGCDRRLFDGGALDRIHAASGGIPRLVNSLAGEALLAAYVEGSHEVKASHVPQRDTGPAAAAEQPRVAAAPEPVPPPPSPAPPPPPAAPSPRRETAPPPAPEPRRASPPPPAPEPSPPPRPVPPPPQEPVAPPPPAPEPPPRSAPPPPPPGDASPPVPDLAPASAPPPREAAPPPPPRAPEPPPPAEPPPPFVWPRRRRRRRSLWVAAAALLLAVLAVLVWSLGGDLLRGRQTSPAEARLAEEAGSGTAVEPGEPEPPADGGASAPAIEPAVEPAVEPGTDRAAGPEADRTGAAGPERAAGESRSGPPPSPAEPAPRQAGASSGSAAPALPPPGAEYMIHVASFRQVDRAATLAERLRRSGFPAENGDAEIDGVTWHRVYSGPYRSVELARQARDRLLAMHLTEYARIFRVHGS